MDAAVRILALSLRAMILALCALAAPSSALAEPGGARPVGAGRVVKVFDFEEQAFNPDPVPRNWVRAQSERGVRTRPGFPPFNRAAFDTRFATSGSTSVRLPTQGGCTSLRLLPTVVPIFADADYLLTARVRTEGLTHARAVLSARLLNQAGEPIPGGEFRSPPTISEGQFTAVMAPIPGRFPAAAFVQIELLLLQPDHWAGPTPRFAVPKEDLSGAAWFDDVVLYQSPRVLLTPEGGRSVIRAPQRVKFLGEVRDLTGDDLDLRLTLRDIDGRILADEPRNLGPGGGLFDWAPEISRFGWYEATMDVLVKGAVISRSRSTVIYAPAAPASPFLSASSAPARVDTVVPFPPASLALHALIDRLEPADAPAAGDLLAATGAGSVTVAIDELLLPVEDADHRLTLVRGLLDRLLDMDSSVTLAIPRIPTAITTPLQADPADPLSLLAHDAKLWSAPLQPVLDLYGQRINRWQIYPSLPETDEPPSADTRAARLPLMRAWLSKMVPGPHLAVSWRADWPEDKGYDLSGSSPAPADALVWMIPAGFPLTTIESLAMDIAQRRAAASRAPDDLTIVLELPDERAFGPRAPVTELLKRAITIWSAMSLGDQRLGTPGSPPPVRLGMAAPWTRDPGAKPAIMPTAALPALRTISDYLAPSRVLGRLKTPDNIHAVILLRTALQEDGTRARLGMLAAWSDRVDPDAQPAFLRTYLGPGPVRLIDAFGNVTPISPIDATGLYEIPVSETPVFFDGIDPELCLFVSSASITPGFVPAIASLHEHELLLANPWSVRLAGSVHLIPDLPATSPRAWSFTPTAPTTFSIAPGATQRIPFSFSFPASEEAGDRTISAVVRLSAAEPYPPIHLKLPITIGSRVLDLGVIAGLGPRASGPDAIVTATITNTGRTPRTLQVDAQAPGLAQQRQPISNLAPGETAMRRFVFPGAAAALAGRRVRITVSDVDGAERLTRSAVVP